MKNKSLTYKQFIKLAKENYCDGGMHYVECWEECNFDDYVQIFGEITREDAIKMFRLSKSVGV